MSDDIGLGSSAVPASDSEVTGGRLLRNTLVNGVANVSGALVTLALTPFLLHRLGTAQYGVWLLALTLTFSSGYVALADLGLPEAAVRFIAEARARRDTQTINEVASTVTAVFAVVGVVAGIAVAALAGPIVDLFGVNAHLASSAKVVFTLMALVVVVDLPAAGLLAVIEGAQQYPWLRAIDSGARLAWAAIVVVAVSAGHGVVALAVTFVGVTVAEAIVAFVAAHRVQPGLQLRPRLATRRTLRRTFSYGSLLTVLKVLSVVYAQMDRAIIGVALAVAAVARYEIALRIESVATLALVVASSAVVPASAYNAARGDTGKQRELYLRGSKYAVALAVPVALSALLFAKYLIIGWVGHRYAGMAGAARLFLAFPLFWCVHQVGISMLVGLGRVKRVVLLQVLCTALNLAVSIALIGPLGISGVILGTIVGFAVVWWPYVQLFLRTFELTLGLWLRSIVLPNVPGAVAQLAVGLLGLRLVQQHHALWQVLGVCGLTCAVSFATFAFAGLSRSERSNLLRHARVE